MLYGAIFEIRTMGTASSCHTEGNLCLRRCLYGSDRYKQPPPHTPKLLFLPSTVLNLFAVDRSLHPQLPRIDLCANILIYINRFCKPVSAIMFVYLVEIVKHTEYWFVDWTGGQFHSRLLVLEQEHRKEWGGGMLLPC